MTPPLRTRAALALLTITLLTAPNLLTAPALAAAASTTNQTDIYNQLSLTGTNTQTCTNANSATGVSLTAGTRYLFIVGSSLASNAGSTMAIQNSGGSHVLFTATGAGTLTGVDASANVQLLDHQNATIWRAVVAATATATETVFVHCGASNSNSIAQAWTAPPGAQSGDCLGNGIGEQTSRNLAGIVGSFTISNSAFCDGGITYHYQVGFVFNDPPTSLLTESGVLLTERDNTATLSTPLNPAQNIANGTGTQSATNKQLEMAQSFAYTTGYGRYLAQTSFAIQQQTVTSCTSTWSISVANVLQHPWSTSAELANITATFTKDASGGAVTVIKADYINGTLTSNTNKITFGTPTLSIGGVTTTSTNTLPPDLSLSGTNYVRSKIWGGTCDLTMISSIGETTASTYNAGDIWTNDGTGWTERTSEDSFLLDYRSYNGGTLLFNLTTNTQNIGGAIYTTIEVDKKDTSTSQGIVPTTTTYGAPIPGAGITNVLTSLVATNEWRVGYLTPVPYTNTQTIQIRLDTTAIGRNLLYTVTYPNTITHPDRANLTFTGTGANLITTQTFSTNDYNTTLYATVRSCTNINANGICTDPTPNTNTPIPNGTWTTAIVSYTTRTTGGLWDTNGNLSFSGQDIQGSYISLTLQASGYTTKTIQFTIPNTPGNYYLNTTMIPQGSFTVNDQGVTLAWSALNNVTRVVPTPFNLNVTRSLHVPVYIDAIKVANGVPRWVLPSPILWDTTQNDTITIAYPTLGRTPIANDAGTYLFYGTNNTGTMLNAQQTACMYATTSTYNATCTLTTTASDLSLFANATTSRIGLLTQATQDAALTQTKAHAENAFVPWVDGFVTPIDATPTNGGTWWLTPLTLIVLASWFAMFIALIIKR